MSSCKLQVENDSWFILEYVLWLCFMQFNKEGDKVIEELKLRVVYTSPSQSGRGNSEEESGLASSATGKRDVRFHTSSSWARQFFYQTVCHLWISIVFISAVSLVVMHISFSSWCRCTRTQAMRRLAIIAKFFLLLVIAVPPFSFCLNSQFSVERLLPALM